MPYSKILIACLISAAAGAAVGIFGTRTYFKKKYEADAEKRILDNLAIEPIVVPVDEVGEVVEAEVPEYEATPHNSSTGIFDGDPMRSYTNYSELYASDEDQHPTEDEDYINDVEGELMTKERQDSKGPRVMEWEEIGMPGLGDEFTLLWHVDERWMETEDGEIIDDPFALVGNCLQESNFDISSQRSIHIINERRGETYEVLKVTGRSM